jgi:uncharacterized protein YkwD
LILCLALVAPAALAQAPRASASQVEDSHAIQAEAWEIVALANQARAAGGAGPLRWDAALAAAARQHCLRMAAEGPIAHRYGGEPDVGGRAAQAGAHFSLIEENVAIGPTPAAIHEEWMHSPDHRANLLNPEVDRVGVALVASRGVLYAVADYARAAPVLTQAQVEAAIASLLRAQGVTLLADPTDARAYCAQNRGAKGSSQPGFRMLWQGADLTRLPQQLLDRIASGRYRQAAVGSCPPRDLEGSFTAYRVAVLLYSTGAGAY